MEDAKMIERITAVEQRAKSNTHQILDLKIIVNEIHELSEAIVVFAKELEHMNNHMIELKVKVETLEQEPSRNWKDTKGKIRDTVITVVVTAVVLMLIKQL